MKIIVFSDSHGNQINMEQALKSEKADIAVFLGDGLGDLLQLENEFLSVGFINIKGNCDLFRAGHTVFINTYDGVRIYATHGHIHKVKEGLENLLSSARLRKADIALFGHTHTEMLKTIDGITFLNPGSIGYGKTYGVIITDNGRFDCEIKKL
ncbi:MAG: YfcE family phosphodiesterase [Clostridiales bacterium]|jgi:putative phosphoesterase|nr:YfcE family phosphodiesterase [Clostridiales bacterium]